MFLPSPFLSFGFSLFSYDHLLMIFLSKQKKKKKNMCGVLFLSYYYFLVPPLLDSDVVLHSDEGYVTIRFSRVSLGGEKRVKKGCT